MLVIGGEFIPRILAVALLGGVEKLGLLPAGNSDGIPLTQEVVELLTAIRRRQEPGPRVFSTHRGTAWNRCNLSLRMQRARERADIPAEVKLYGLRHAFGTRAIINGVDIKTLAELLGHTTTRMDDWAKTQPASRWHKVQRGDGAKGPKVVRVAEAWVQTKGEQGRCGPLERLVVVRAVDGQPRTWYTLSNAPAREPLARVAGVQGRRHGVEEAKGEGQQGCSAGPVAGDTGVFHSQFVVGIGQGQEQQISGQEGEERTQRLLRRGLLRRGEGRRPAPLTKSNCRRQLGRLK